MSPAVLAWALYPMTGVLTGQGGGYTEMHIWGRTPGEDRENWSEAATSQGIPCIAESHQKLGRGKGGFFPRLFKGSQHAWPSQQLDCRLQASRTVTK